MATGVDPEPGPTVGNRQAALPPGLTVEAGAPTPIGAGDIGDKLAPIALNSVRTMTEAARRRGQGQVSRAAGDRQADRRDGRRRDRDGDPRLELPLRRTRVHRAQVAYGRAVTGPAAEGEGRPASARGRLQLDLGVGHVAADRPGAHGPLGCLTPLDARLQRRHPDAQADPGARRRRRGRRRLVCQQDDGLTGAAFRHGGIRRGSGRRGASQRAGVVGVDVGVVGAGVGVVGVDVGVVVAGADGRAGGWGGRRRGRAGGRGGCRRGRAGRASGRRGDSRRRRGGGSGRRGCRRGDR